MSLSVSVRPEAFWHDVHKMALPIKSHQKALVPPEKSLKVTVLGDDVIHLVDFTSVDELNTITDLMAYFYKHWEC